MSVHEDCPSVAVLRGDGKAREVQRRDQVPREGRASVRGGARGTVGVSGGRLGLSRKGTAVRSWKGARRGDSSLVCHVPETRGLCSKLEGDHLRLG